MTLLEETMALICWRAEVPMHRPEGEGLILALEGLAGTDTFHRTTENQCCPSPSLPNGLHQYSQRPRRWHWDMTKEAAGFRAVYWSMAHLSAVSCAAGRHNPRLCLRIVGIQGGPCHICAWNSRSRGRPSDGLSLASCTISSPGLSQRGVLQPPRCTCGGEVDPGMRESKGQGVHRDEVMSMV